MLKCKSVRLKFQNVILCSIDNQITNRAIYVFESLNMQFVFLLISLCKPVVFVILLS